MVAQSVACPFSMQVASRSTFPSGIFFRGGFFHSAADSRRASCQLLSKEWALNTGKLPLGGLPIDNVVM